MSEDAEGFSERDDDPLMLLALNSDKCVSWKELKDKVLVHANSLTLS